jgi:hypothetical protein
MTENNTPLNFESMSDRALAVTRFELACEFERRLGTQEACRRLGVASMDELIAVACEAIESGHAWHVCPGCRCRTVASRSDGCQEGSTVSEETASALALAKEEESLQRAVVDPLKQNCLNSVAQGVSASVDRYAKKVAQAQPDVTRALGRDGVSALREDLSRAAGELATELRRAVAAVKWPTFAYGRSHNNGVASALYDFLSGSRVGRFDRILRAHRYKIEDYHGFSPYDLIEREGFNELEVELEILASKVKAVEAAKDADDQDAVESLWDETS